MPTDDVPPRAPAEDAPPRRHTAPDSVRVGSDDGAATILAATCCLLLVALTGLVVQLGAAAVARHRAELAADAAALAGAYELAGGVDAACRSARDAAVRNDAAVSSCRADGVDLLVEVTVRVRLGPVASTATARARAGPASG